MYYVIVSASTNKHSIAERYENRGPDRALCAQSIKMTKKYVLSNSSLLLMSINTATVKTMKYYHLTAMVTTKMKTDAMIDSHH